MFEEKSPDASENKNGTDQFARSVEAYRNLLARRIAERWIEHHSQNHTEEPPNENDKPAESSPD
ncbi:MAG: hypothetical protein CMJ46_03945 [Planctomyces sp.]|nr:hypothetical protein [Planctomyces sp.]